MMGFFPLNGILTIAFLVNLSPVQAVYTHMTPSGTVHKAVGEELVLVCSYRNGTTDNSSDRLSIDRCRDQEYFNVPSVIVNGTSIRASIQSRLRGDGQHTYTCRYNKNHRTMAITYVRVGSPPSPPKDIYCFSRDHLDMNCTVTLAKGDAKPHIPLNVTIHFQSTRSTVWLECPKYYPQYHCCYWKSPNASGSHMDNDFVSNRGYIIRATAQNALGSNQSVRDINDTRTIVTISKLPQFKVTNVTSRKAVLTWVLPDRLLPVTFMINFAVNYSSRWDQRQLMYSSRSIMSTTLMDLIPHTRYTVSIRARSQLVTDERSWSPVNMISFKTEKDAPSAAPRSTVGGYFLHRRGINNTDINCALHIYVKPIPRKHRNADLSDIYYKVSVHGESKTMNISNPTSTLTLSHKSCWNKGPYDVVIKTCIEERCSNKQTDIHIPFVDQDTDTEFPRVTDVIAEGFGDTSFNVSWSIAPYVDESLVRGVTVFWCRRSSSEQHLCKSNLSWQKIKKIKKLVTSAEIKVKHSNYREWMFAVSLTTQNGESAGMVFDDCQFKYDETQSRSSTDIAPVKPTFNLLTRDVEGSAITSRDIVSLSFRYCDAPLLYRKPEQYEVFYKKSPGDTGDDCSKGAQSFNVTSTLHVKEIVLPDLDPMSQYSVCMRIRTSVGTSELSDVKLRKALNIPDESVIALVLGITVASILFLVIGFGTIRCVVVKYKALDTTIDVPFVDKGHQITGEKSKSVMDSDEDSGFNSQANTTHSIEEKKKPMQNRRPRTQLASARSSAESEAMLARQESKDLENPGLTATDGRLHNTTANDMFRNSETKLDRGLSDYCQTDQTENNGNSCSTNTDMYSRADCCRIKRVAAGLHDTENDEKVTLMEVDDSNTASALVHMGSQMSKETTSRVVMNLPGDNYRPQLDMGTIISIGEADIQTRDYNDCSNTTLNSDVSRDDVNLDRPCEDFHSRDGVNLDKPFKDFHSQDGVNLDTPFDDFHSRDGVNLDTPFDDFHNKIAVNRHKENSPKGVKFKYTKQRYHSNCGRSQIRLEGDNPSERTLLVTSPHKPYVKSLETACLEDSRFGTNTNAPDIDVDNSEREHLLAYLNCDDEADQLYSKPRNDSSSTCSELHRNSGTCSELHRNSGTCWEPHRNSGTCCELHRNSGTCCELHRNSGTCCEPHRNSGTCSELHRNSGTCCEPHRNSGTCCEPHRNTGTCCEPHRNSGTCCEPHRNSGTCCEPHRNSGTCCELHRNSGTCCELHREQTFTCCEPNICHTNTSLTGFEPHIRYKKIDGENKVTARSKVYVAKLC